MQITKKRDLIYELVRKNFKIRYSRPVLGIFWMFLAPFLIVGIFYVAFSVVLKVNIEEAPFVLYLMSAVFPWRFFQESLIASTTSLIDNKNLISETRFPYYLIPVSIVFTNGVIFLPSFILLVLASLFILKGLPIFFFIFPIVLIMHFCITIGLSIVLSILYVKWRDIKYALEPLLLLLFYMTPIFYSIRLVKNSLHPLLYKLYIYNPLVGILSLYRLVLFKDASRFTVDYFGYTSLLVMPIIFTLSCLSACFFVYKKYQHQIIDYISY